METVTLEDCAQLKLCKTVSRTEATGKRDFLTEPRALPADPASVISTFPAFVLNEFSLTD